MVISIVFEGTYIIHNTYDHINCKPLCANLMVFPIHRNCQLGKSVSDSAKGTISKYYVNFCNYLKMRTMKKNCARPYCR